MANEKRLIKMCDVTKVYNGISLYMAENAYLNDTALDVLKMVANWLNEAPTVEAVEVVRCKDCKHLTADGLCWEKIRGSVGYKEISLDDFCSYGERKQ